MDTSEIATRLLTAEAEITRLRKVVWLGSVVISVSLVGLSLALVMGAKTPLKDLTVRSLAIVNEAGHECAYLGSAGDGETALTVYSQTGRGGATLCTTDLGPSLEFTGRAGKPLVQFGANDPEPGHGIDPTREGYLEFYDSKGNVVWSPN